MFFTLSKTLNLLLDPLFYVYLFAFILVFLISKKKNLKFLVFLTLLLIFYVLSTPFVSNLLSYQLEFTEAPQMKNSKYDAIIILSGMINPQISTSTEIAFGDSVERILTGIQLMREKKAKYLLISGGSGSLFSDLSEAKLLKDFSINLGISAKNIIIEENSKNTYQNALMIKPLLLQYQLKKILLITSALHMPRAKGCFNSAGISPDILPVDYKTNPEIVKFKINLETLFKFFPSSLALMRTKNVIHEALGIFLYRMLGYYS